MAAPAGSDARLRGLIADAVERPHHSGLQALLQIAPGHQLQLTRLVRADVVLRMQTAWVSLPSSMHTYVLGQASAGQKPEDTALCRITVSAL